MSTLHEYSLPENHSLAGISECVVLDRSWAWVSHCSRWGVGRDRAWLKTTCRHWVLSPSRFTLEPLSCCTSSWLCRHCLRWLHWRRGAEEGVWENLNAFWVRGNIQHSHGSVLNGMQHIAYQRLLIWNKKGNVIGIEEWEPLTFLRLAHPSIKTRGH